jgi:hypothetical protein
MPSSGSKEGIIQAPQSLKGLGNPGGSTLPPSFTQDSAEIAKGTRKTAKTKPARKTRQYPKNKLRAPR